MPCNRCHVASAKVEVITRTGSVFVCSRHHKMHHKAILAAGHQVRAGLSPDLLPEGGWPHSSDLYEQSRRLYMNKADVAFTAVRLRCGLVVSGTFAVWPATGTGCVEPSVG